MQITQSLDADTGDLDQDHPATRGSLKHPLRYFESLAFIVAIERASENRVLAPRYGAENVY